MLKKTPLKRNQSQLKKTSLKKISPNKIEKVDKKQQRINDEEFYSEVIKDRKSKSDLTGNYLNNATKFNVHHLLPKSLYPQYRYKKWNVILIEESTHSQIEISPTKLVEELYDRFMICLHNARKEANLV